MQSDEDAIRELIATWMSATKAGDNEKVLSLMAHDAVFLVAGQAPMRGKAAFAAAQAGMAQFEIDGHSEIQEINVSGNWAHCWTQLTVTITPRAGGKTIKRAGNTLSVLRKEGGKWLLYRDANLLSVVPQ
jgi:uncharacterized protein (TIGR02246 family)